MAIYWVKLKKEEIFVSGWWGVLVGKWGNGKKDWWRGEGED